LLAYVVEQRRKDIGIRMALGARREEVIAGVLRSGLALAGIGVVIGIAASLALGRTIRGLLSGVSTHDPATLFGSAVTVLVVAAAACLVPALRASKVDPVVTLSAE
jgi:ABC-type antimicrobial peptide transport system permease subunit